MPFLRPTLQEIVDRIEADYKARIEDKEGANTATSLLSRSVLKILSRSYGGAVHLLYDYLAYQKDQLFVTTADKEYLEQQGAEYGINRTAGTKATGSATASGTNGVTIPVGTELQSIDGKIYTVNTAATIAGGIATLAFTAEEIGDEYNQSGGISLTFISPISGVTTTVTVSGTGITGGIAEETDDDYRDRVLTRKRQPPHGGADFDYTNWMLENSGVTRAWLIEQYHGIGTVGCAFVYDDRTSIVPTSAERTTMKSYIESHANPTTGFTEGMPVTAKPGLFIIPVEPLAVNFHIKVYPYTSAVIASIEARLASLMTEYGGVGETISISQMWEAVTSATGEERSELVSPVADVSAATNQVHVLGDVVIEELE